MPPPLRLWWRVLFALVLTCCVLLGCEGTSNTTESSHYHERIDLTCLKAVLGHDTAAGLVDELQLVSRCLNWTSAVGVVRLLVPLDFNSSSLGASLQALQNETGWSFNLTSIDTYKLNTSSPEFKAVLRDHDAWLFDASWTVELKATGLLQSISDEWKQELGWSDYYSAYQLSSLYNESLVSIPLSGDVASLYLRADLLNGTAPPATWEELLWFARQRNGTDMNKDGAPDFALCMPSIMCDDGATLLAQILASMTQYVGTRSGWLFSVQDLTPLVDNPAMVRALELFNALHGHTWRNTTMPQPNQSTCMHQAIDMVSSHFMAGQCAVLIGGYEVFKRLHLASRSPPPWAKAAAASWLSVAELPGSHVVLDKTTGQLSDCYSSEYCLYSTPIWSPITQRVELVTRAPLTQSSGIAGFISKEAELQTQSMALRMLTMLSGRAASQRLLATGTGGPYRRSQMSGPAAQRSLQQAVLGENTTQLANASKVIERGLASRNVALPVRLLGRDMVWDAMRQAAVMSQTGSPPSQTITQLSTALLTLNTSPQVLLGYQAGLQYIPASYHNMINGSNSTGSSNSDKDDIKPLGALVFMGAVAAVGVVLACIMYVLANSKQWHPNLRLRGPPLCGFNTTILVTDIENSTLLWESVAQDVMNLSVELHHTLVRLLLHKHNGYESATEGDSFIAAFHQPAKALAFAQAFQLELLQQEWPAGLLNSPYASCLWAKSVSTNANFSDGLRLHSMSGMPPKGNSAPGYGGSDGSPAQVNNMVSTDTRGGPVWRNNGVLAMFNRQSVGPNSPTTQDQHRFVSAPNGGSTETEQMDAMFAYAQDTIKTGNDETTGALMATLTHARESLGPTEPVNGNFSEMLRGLSSEHPDGGTQSPSPIIKQATSGSLGGGSHPRTVIEFMQSSWRACLPPSVATKAKRGQRLVHRGLRVRVGMHTGISDPQDAVLNKTTNRIQYSGQPLALAKAVADCGHGGMVLMSQASFEGLPTDMLRLSEAMVVCMGEFTFVKNSALPVTGIYQIVIKGLEQRIPFLSPMMRDVVSLQRGVMHAPIGHVAIAFCNMVGASTLLAWNREVAQKALLLYQEAAIQIMHNGCDLQSVYAGSYLVEMAGGLCLASFSCPSSAILWGLRLIKHLKTAAWHDELLSHELCEQVVLSVQPTARRSNVHGGSNGVRTSVISNATFQHSSDVNRMASSASRASNAISESTATFEFRKETKSHDHLQILFRGPRLKIGIDIGAVHAHINPTTGRMTYRGRVMNRSARVAEKTGSGQVWCSEKVWETALEEAGDELGELRVEGQLLGGFTLKGVQEEVQLFQLALNDLAAPISVSGAVSRSEVVWEDSPRLGSLHDTFGVGGSETSGYPWRALDMKIPDAGSSGTVDMKAPLERLLETITCPAPAGLTDTEDRSQHGGASIKSASRVLLQQMFSYRHTGETTTVDGLSQHSQDALNTSTVVNMMSSTGRLPSSHADTSQHGTDDHHPSRASGSKSNMAPLSQHIRFPSHIRSCNSLATVHADQMLGHCSQTLLCSERPLRPFQQLATVSSAHAADADQGLGVVSASKSATARRSSLVSLISRTFMPSTSPPSVSLKEVCSARNDLSDSSEGETAGQNMPTLLWAGEISQV